MSTMNGIKCWTVQDDRAGVITLTRYKDRGSIQFMRYSCMAVHGRWDGDGDGAIFTVTDRGPQRGYCYNECGELVSR